VQKCSTGRMLPFSLTAGARVSRVRSFNLPLTGQLTELATEDAVAHVHLLEEGVRVHMEADEQVRVLDTFQEPVCGWPSQSTNSESAVMWE
jgi:hypothetical protein